MSLSPNKIRVTFELDLTKFDGFRPDTKQDIGETLQNLGCFLANLRTYYLEQAFFWATKREEETENTPGSETMVSHYKEQAELAKQIFDNYKLEGTLKDGTEFRFTHKEPGYHEELVFSDDEGAII